MKSMLSLYGVFLALTVGLFGSLWSGSGAVGAGAACLNPYVVQRGDTLSSIAQRFGTRVSVLTHLNFLPNPHLIRIGQILCLPEAAPPPTRVIPTATVTSTVEATPTFSLDVVAEYTLSNANPDVNVGPNRRAGIRRHYSVTNRSVLSKPTEVGIISSQASPLLWLVGDRNEKPVTFTLVIINDPQLLYDLQLTADLTTTRPLTEIFSSLPSPEEITNALDNLECLANTLPVAALLDRQATEVVVRLELVDEFGVFMPIKVDQIDYQANAAMAQLCHPLVFAALNAKTSQLAEDYQLMIVAEVFKTGPAGGEGQRARCRRWGKGGYWSRFLYYLWC